MFPNFNENACTCEEGVMKSTAGVPLLSCFDKWLQWTQIFFKVSRRTTIIDLQLWPAGYKKIVLFLMWFWNPAFFHFSKIDDSSVYIDFFTNQTMICNHLSPHWNYAFPATNKWNGILQRAAKKWQITTNKFKYLVNLIKSSPPAACYLKRVSVWIYNWALFAYWIYWSWCAELADPFRIKRSLMLQIVVLVYLYPHSSPCWCIIHDALKRKLVTTLAI